MKKIHYSWVICASGTILMFAAVGLTITAFSVYQPYIISVNGFSNTQASMLTSIRSVFFLVALMLVEPVYKKLNLRWGMTLAMVLTAGCFFLYGVSKGYFMYCVSSALAGVAYAMGGMIPVSLLIGRWFRDKVGLAMGICSAGTGISAVVVPPIATKIIETQSLRAAFLFEGVCVVALAVLIFLLVRNSPAEKGLTPLRAAEKPGKKAEDRVVHKSKINLDKRTFIYMLIAMAFLTSMGNTGYCHLAVLYSTEGYSADAVAAIMSFAGVSLMVGKCIYGNLADRIGGYRSNVVAYGLSVLGAVFCALAGTRSVILPYAAMLALNIGIPISTVGMSIWAHDLSDGVHYARNLKWFQMSYAVGGIAFSALPGALADLTGSYVPAYVIFAVMMAVSFLLVQVSYLRNRRRALAAGMEADVPEGELVKKHV